jgi:hypothetical protein
MFYACDHPVCAIWETTLRNLVIEGPEPQHVDRGLLAGKSIVELEVTQELKILDVRAPYFRRLSDDAKRHAEWLRLAVVSEGQYAETHAEAKALLERYPEATGLRWFSKQHGEQCAYVFYRPPHRAASFREVNSHALDTPEGWVLVDEALRVVGVKRLGASALAAELDPELPPAT